MSDETKKIGIGDDVYLNADGPEMKVESVDGDECVCVWIDKKHAVHRADFKIHTLSKVSRGYA